MFTDQWQLGAVVAALLVHALVTYHVYRLRRRDGEAVPGGSSAGDHVDPERGVVECPDCGTENERGYRYCRDCVGQLPMAMEFHRAGSGPMGRLTR